VIFIVLDDVGFAHLGCYGSTIDTPHIDALAARGLRYTNFNTTAMCSPTRASLLTGRNHHAVGMGTIADWCTGHPGYMGEISRSAATLPEMLRLHGYNSFATGKWHLSRGRDGTAAGPFDHWPLGRGFDQYYGFLHALADHWNPELFRDNHAIDAPRTPGYHLTEDLISESIAFIRDQQAAAPGKPFFSYIALGACHSPHHAPQSYIDKYKGRFDAGWDEAREQWFARQLELGIAPPGTRLTPRNAKVRPWAALSADERRLAARMQEVFAGFLDHTDSEIGRLVSFLRDNALLDNTLLVLLSDNGASDEGGEHGDLNIRRHYSFLPEHFDELLANIDRLGSQYTYNNYPSGWGHAGNTPHPWFKIDTHGGGIRDPLIVHWPDRIADAGGIRTQYHHCTDLVPTVLEVLGLEAPASHQGIAQLPISGTSMAYTFSDAAAPERKTVQYYEMLGDRGIWSGGWKAVTHHEKGTDFAHDRWELYHLAQDFSESEDLAGRYPEKLQELVRLWWSQARANNVLPLDDRDRERALRSFRRDARQRYRLLPHTRRLDRSATPPMANRSFRITADAQTGPEAEGVLFAAGGRFGGNVLFVQKGRLVFEYNGPYRRWTAESAAALPAGRHKLAFDFIKTAPFAGTGTLSVDGETVATVHMTDMWQTQPNSGGTHCGRDDGSPVSERYRCPFAYTDVLHEVVVVVGDDYAPDSRMEYLLAMSED
jgi:arylsulfatase